MEEKQISSTVRLTPDFQEQVRVAIARRRLRSFQQAVEQALGLWLEKDAAPGPRPVAVPTSATLPGATKEEQALAQQFLDFMRSGEPGQVELMKHALELHSKKQRQTRKRSSA